MWGNLWRRMKSSNPGVAGAQREVWQSKPTTVADKKANQVKSSGYGADKLTLFFLGAALRSSATTCSGEEV